MSKASRLTSSSEATENGGGAIGGIPFSLLLLFPFRRRDKKKCFAVRTGEYDAIDPGVDEAVDAVEVDVLDFAKFPGALLITAIGGSASCSVQLLELFSISDIISCNLWMI